jgi:thioester reductase-like protein
VSAPAGGRTVLFTGFPGFIGMRLLPRLLELMPAARVACLVQEKFLPLARESAAALERRHPFTAGRIVLCTGDITRPGLGLEEAAARELRETVAECHHLAAVYDLAVSRELGHRVNVLGTRHVLEFLAGVPRLERLHYVSTAYVSGTARGPFKETDLDVGQGFKNHYEQTKFEAEVEVARSALPRTIYRPGVVVGDSRTGETGKFDGPYYVLRLMQRLPSPGLFVLAGSGKGTVNVVPVDFLVEALARLAVSPGSLGKTYHLTDPSPLQAVEIARLFAAALGKRFAYLPVPVGLAKAAVRPLRGWLGLPVEALDYFDDQVRHDAAIATADLGRLGVACPRLPEYVPRLVSFFRAERDRVRREAMA